MFMWQADTIGCACFNAKKAYYCLCYYELHIKKNNVVMYIITLVLESKLNFDIFKNNILTILKEIKLSNKGKIK